MPGCQFSLQICIWTVWNHTKVHDHIYVYISCGGSSAIGDGEAGDLLSNCRERENIRQEERVDAKVVKVVPGKCSRSL